MRRLTKLSGSAIEKELEYILSKEERRMERRHLETKLDLDDVMNCYRRIHGHLERLTVSPV